MLISKAVDETGLSTLCEEDEKMLMNATKYQPCCVIPARGGSKRIKHKNMRLMNGRPLFDYALKAALDSGVFHLIIVSSDDTDILAHAYSYFRTEKVQPQKRPKPISGDNVPIKVPLRYAIQSYNAPNTICLLQPTNPLITADVIKKAYDLYRKENPQYLFGICKGKDMGFHLFERNTFLTEYDQVWDVEYLPFEMKGVDIDDEDDWVEAERLLKS